jgi:hypothetical protein
MSISPQFDHVFEAAEADQAPAGLFDHRQAAVAVHGVVAQRPRAQQFARLVHRSRRVSPV